MRVERREVVVPGLPAALDGLSVLHLTDLHLGGVGRNATSLARAVDAGRALDPDIVVWTGDVTAGRPLSARSLALLGGVRGRFATVGVRGNHDGGVAAATRDPFSGGGRVDAAELPFDLLDDRSVTVDVRGVRVELAGVRPERDLMASGALAALRAGRPTSPAAPPAVRLLCAHYPTSVNGLRDGEFAAAFAGHVHGGQIVLPAPSRRGVRELRCSSLGDPFAAGGAFSPAGAGGAVLLVARGTGTTFVPFRFRCRPEAPVWILRAPVAHSIP